MRTLPPRTPPATNANTPHPKRNNRHLRSSRYARWAMRALYKHGRAFYPYASVAAAKAK